MTDIPEWARQRAADLINEAEKIRGGCADWIANSTGSGSFDAFARYIAAHEEAPVDPLLIEARALCVRQFPGSGHDFSSGAHDEGTAVGFALAALRRGMELAASDK